MIRELPDGMEITYDDLVFRFNFEKDTLDVKKNGLTITVPALTLIQLNKDVQKVNDKWSAKLQDQLDGLFGEGNAPSLDEILDKETSNEKDIIDYILANYSKEDAEKISKIKMTPVIVMDTTRDESEKEALIDKIALFNGIKKK